MLKKLGLFTLVTAFLALFFVMPIAVHADDFALPPPPDANEDLLPPPPGGAGMGDAALPPPPGESTASAPNDALPPPPGDDTGALPPPPGEEAGGALPPPPGEEAGGALPPPPAEEASGALPPPPGDDTGALPPPPAEEASAPAPIGEEAKAPATPERVVKKSRSKAPKAGTSNYSVKNGDSLWRISGKNSVYGNAFKWPLVFKTNRASIEDPDLIYPRQALKISKNFTSDEEDDAVGKAKETPPFEPHAEPRKSLPIKY